MVPITIVNGVYKPHCTAFPLISPVFLPGFSTHPDSDSLAGLRHGPDVWLKQRQGPAGAERASRDGLV